MTKMFRTNRKDVPLVQGLKRDDGWIDIQVQFLIDKKSAGADNVVGWTVLKPGASQSSICTATATNSLSSSKAMAILSPIMASNLPARRCVYSPRGAGTASTTRPTKMSCWSGVGWAPARSRLGLRSASRNTRQARDASSRPNSERQSAFSLSRRTGRRRRQCRNAWSKIVSPSSYPGYRSFVPVIPAHVNQKATGQRCNQTVIPGSSLARSPSGSTRMRSVLRS